MKKLIICVAPVGNLGNDENNPLSPTEIAEETFRCYQQGASMVHLHLRDEYGNATTDKKKFEETVNLIRKKCDIIIQAPIGDSNLINACKRSVVLDIPDVEVSSLVTGSHNVFNTVSVNSIDDIKYWLKIMTEKNIIPEINVFELGMVDVVKKFIFQGLLTKERYYYNLCLGFPGCMAANIQNLNSLVSSIGEEVPWFYSEFGGECFMPVAKAISFGGNIVVGFEVNAFLEEGIKAESNAELVSKSVRISKGLGRQIASVQEAREILGIAK